MVLTYSALLPAALLLLRVPVPLAAALWATALPMKMVFEVLGKRSRAARRASRVKAEAAAAVGENK